MIVGIADIIGFKRKPQKSNHQGVIYKSSVQGDGINLALFDPKTAPCGQITEYEITGVSVEMGRV